VVQAGGAIRRYGVGPCP